MLIKAKEVYIRTSEVTGLSGVGSLTEIRGDGENQEKRTVFFYVAEGKTNEARIGVFDSVEDAKKHREVLVTSINLHNKNNEATINLVNKK